MNEKLTIIRYWNFGEKTSRYQVVNSLAMRQLRSMGCRFEKIGRVVRDYRLQAMGYETTFRYVDLENGQTFAVFHNDGARVAK